MDTQNDRTLIVLADGAGGVTGSAAVADFVCQRLLQQFRDGAPRDSWLAELRALDTTLAESSLGGLSTVVVAELHDGFIRGASVGDSEAWLVSRSQNVDLTANQNRKPLLGTGTAIPVEFGPVSFQGRLLVASDGLFRYAPLQRIVTVASTEPIDRAVHALIDLVRLSNGRLQDDVSVALGDSAG